MAAETDNLPLDSKNTPAAIIFTSSTALRSTLRESVKAVGVYSPALIESEGECIKELQANAKAWLIMDMIPGYDTVVRILTAAQGPTALETRPIFIFSSQSDHKLLSMALEFNVAKIHSGEINPTVVKAGVLAVQAAHKTFNDLEPLLKRVKESRHNGQWQDAVAMIEKELNGSPLQDRLTLEMLDILIEASELDRAQPVAESYLKRNPTDLRAIYSLVRCLMKQKKFDQATKLLADAEKINSFRPQRLVALGDCYLELGCFKDAKSKFTSALKIDPKSYEARAGATKAEFLTGNLDDALQMAKHLGSPENIAKTLNAAGILAMQYDKTEQAKAMYEVCITMLDGIPILASRVWFNLGLCHYKTGMKDKALKCFKEYSTLDPKFEAAIQNMQQIKKNMPAKGRKK